MKTLKNIFFLSLFSLGFVSYGYAQRIKEPVIIEKTKKPTPKQPVKPVKPKPNDLSVWKQAHQNGTQQSYYRYLTLFPKGVYSELAENEIRLLNLKDTYIDSRKDVKENTDFLKDAISATNEAYDKGVIYNLEKYQVYLKESNLTPERLSKEDIELYNQAIYQAVYKIDSYQLHLPENILKQAIPFIKYSATLRPHSLYVLGYLYHEGGIRS